MSQSDMNCPFLDLARTRTAVLEDVEFESHANDTVAKYNYQIY